MKDKKFVIALALIVVLVLVLLYVLVVAPNIQGYVVNKQVDAQKILIKSMIDAANQNGYITLNDGENNVVLINQKLLEQQAAQAQAQQPSQ